MLQAVCYKLTKNFLACLLWGELISASAAAKPEVSVKETAAKEFLSSLRRQRRQLWDRSQPDVQQWYQQFLYLGFDEQVSVQWRGLIKKRENRQGQNKGDWFK